MGTYGARLELSTVRTGKKPFSLSTRGTLFGEKWGAASNGSSRSVAFWTWIARNSVNYNQFSNRNRYSWSALTAISLNRHPSSVLMEKAGTQSGIPSAEDSPIKFIPTSSLTFSVLRMLSVPKICRTICTGSFASFATPPM